MPKGKRSGGTRTVNKSSVTGRFVKMSEGGSLFAAFL